MPHAMDTKAHHMTDWPPCTRGLRRGICGTRTHEGQYRGTPRATDHHLSSLIVTRSLISVQVGLRRRQTHGASSALNYGETYGHTVFSCESGASDSPCYGKEGGRMDRAYGCLRLRHGKHTTTFRDPAARAEQEGSNVRLFASFRHTWDAELERARSREARTPCYTSTPASPRRTNTHAHTPAPADSG